MRGAVVVGSLFSLRFLHSKKCFFQNTTLPSFSLSLENSLLFLSSLAANEMLGRLALSAGRKGAPAALASAAGSWPSPAASSLFFQSSAAMTAAAAAAATPSATSTSTSTSTTKALARTSSSAYLFFSSSARASGGNSSSDEDEGQRTARPKVRGNWKDEKARNHFWALLARSPPWPKKKKKKTAPPFPAPHPRSPLPPLLFRIHYTHTHTHNPSSGVVPPRGRHLLPPRVPRVVRGLLPFPGPRDRGLAAAPRPAQARGVLLDRVAADPRRAAVVRRGGGAGDGRGLCGW